MNDIVNERWLVPDYIEAVAKTNPKRIAIYQNDQSISYQELVEQFYSVAFHLQNSGVGSGNFIGVYYSDVVEAIIAMLAIMKLGAVYVPIDKRLPAARIFHMIEQCQVGTVLSHSKEDKQAFKKLTIDFINIDTLNRVSEKINTVAQSIENIAYVNFSSGSTGTPKAIACTHRGIIRLFVGQDYVNFSERLIFLQASPYYFDAFNFEVWGALITGNQVVISSNELSCEHLIKLINQYKVNIAWLTSSLFTALATANPNVFLGIKYLLVGGDVVSPKHVKAVYDCNKSITIINGYGPTENTTFTACYSIPRDNLSKRSVIPIGKCLKGTDYFVANENENECGELYVSGSGLAVGYIEDGKIVDSDKFFYSKTLGSRAYKTGDLVKVNNNGLIEFKGRTDRQVKVNGFRVELDEIEYTTRQFEKINNAHCIKWKCDNIGERLVLFVESTQQLKKNEVLSFLKEHLPFYALPKEVIRLSSFPLKATGKINVDILIKENLLNFDQKPSAYSIQEIIKEIWSKLLGGGINLKEEENFFELGGDSLTAINCVSLISKYLPCSLILPSDLVYRFPKFTDLVMEVSKSIIVISEKENNTLFIWQQVFLNELIVV